MEQVRRFAFDVGWGLASSVATLLISFVLKIVIARWLGAADLGLYTMIITIQGISALVASLGIPVALVKYVAEYKDNRYKLSQTITSALASSIAFGILTSALLYGLSEVLASVFGMPELTRLLKILACVFPFASILQTLLGLFNGLREMKTYACLVTVHSCLMILFILTFVWLEFGVEGAVFGIILSTVGGCIIGLCFSKKYLRLNFEGIFQNVKKIVLFGSQLFGANMANVIANNADIILIGYFLTATEVGYYTIAVSMSMLFPLIPLAIQRISYPATSEYWSKNNHQALQKMIDKSMKYSACILLPLGLGVGFFTKEIITIIFGADFIYAALPLVILLIARVIRGSTILPIGASFSGIGRPDIALKLDALATILNIGLNILLIPRLGIAGAAMATTIALLVSTFIFMILLPRMMGVRIDTRWHVLTMGLACVAIALFLAGTRLTNPYIVGGAILCGYVILIFKVFLTKEDRAMFGSLIHWLIHRR